MTPTSGVEFLVWLLIAAAIIAMVAKRLRIPYTVSLVCGGLSAVSADGCLGIHCISLRT
jgi:hypothetical protein